MTLEREQTADAVLVRSFLGGRDVGDASGDNETKKVLIISGVREVANSLTFQKFKKIIYDENRFMASFFFFFGQT